MSRSSAESAAVRTHLAKNCEERGEAPRGGDGGGGEGGGGDTVPREDRWVRRNEAARASSSELRS